MAVVTGAHGVRGEVRLKIFADGFAAHRAFNGGALKLESFRNGIGRFAGVTDRTAAEALRGTALTVPRSSLPPLGEGEYYHVDLIGLAARSEAGDALGLTVAVENYGASDVVEIERPDGRRFLVPLTPQAVPHWDETTLTVNMAFVD
ncbi:16S rRNA processing protein RimM [Sphingomonas spermidinifaciens]|uniref:Ribosome maturation factor RimM n=1 Tax=Sphingomonas spermidinifaciens TaxID=1141889 RepID=A0A2A4B5D7_9SPHN|nr:ribosome maturation factor RimM [Sphingomonas spermidinifaciens]PCD02864.1 16S rRNA processing protein RimM [Sphingomonas spermidinifaciens]